TGPRSSTATAATTARHPGPGEAPGSPDKAPDTVTGPSGQDDARGDGEAWLRTSSGQLTDVFGGVSLTRTLWPHQARALGTLDQADGAQVRAGKATYLVVPPGGGKTLIGLEAARRLGRPAVVLCPSTAIQAQI